MFSSVMKLLAIVVLLCVLIESSSATHTWGNMNGDGSAFVRSKSRVSKPSSGRKMKITFPDDFLVEGKPDALKGYTIINGIELYEAPDDSCESQATITKGGIGQAFATVRITAAPGCRLDTRMTVRAQRPYGEEDSDEE